MRHLVDRDRDRQDQDVVLALLDLYTVGIRDAEPLLRDLGDLVAALADAVLVIEDVALNLEIRAVGNVDSMSADRPSRSRASAAA